MLNIHYLQDCMGRKPTFAIDLSFYVISMKSSIQESDVQFWDQQRKTFGAIVTDSPLSTEETSEEFGSMVFVPPMKLITPIG